jgi:hypothetical protein
MENHSFSSLYVSKLPVKALYALNKSTIELSRPIISQIGPIAGAGLNYLETINQHLVISLNKSTKSVFTTQVQEFDVERDTDINEIKRITASFLKSSNPEKKSAASLLQLFLSPFWDVDSMPQDIETGIVDDMITKYNARPDLMAAANVIDVAGLFISAADKNRAFDLKWKSRNAEYSKRPESASSIKPIAVAAYIQYCTAIEQILNFAPNDTVTALFNQMDELRKSYRSQEGGKNTPAAPDATASK